MDPPCGFRREPSVADPPAGAASFFAADPRARPAAGEPISAVGLEPVFTGDATAGGTVDALLPLWFALVKQRGGNGRPALRLATWKGNGGCMDFRRQ